MEKEQREIQSFLKRLRPSVRYFYRAAYAITADRQMAEFSLGEALVKAYMKGIAPSGALGFRDSVLTVIRECAMAQLEAEPSEGEWAGFSPDPEKNDRIAALIAHEPMEVQRMCVLRYGCAATVREIAALLDTSTDHVQEALNRCRLRIERAIELIQEGKLKIAEIAEAVGYTNDQTFRRAFKRVMGVSPTAYKDACMGASPENGEEE